MKNRQTLTGTELKVFDDDEQDEDEDEDEDDDDNDGVRTETSRTTLCCIAAESFV